MIAACLPKLHASEGFDMRISKWDFDSFLIRWTAVMSQNDFLIVLKESLEVLQCTLCPFLDFKMVKTHLNRPKLTQTHLQGAVFGPKAGICPSGENAFFSGAKRLKGWKSQSRSAWEDGKSQAQSTWRQILDNASGEKRLTPEPYYVLGVY